MLGRTWNWICLRYSDVGRGAPVELPDDVNVAAGAGYVKCSGRCFESPFLSQGFIGPNTKPIKAYRCPTTLRRRGAIIKDAGKTRVTMYLDNDVLEHFRTLATQKGRGYQTEINAALRSTLSGKEAAPVQAGHRSRGVAQDVMGGLLARLDQMVGRLDRIEEHVGMPTRYFVREPGTAAPPGQPVAKAVKRASRAKPARR